MDTLYFWHHTSTLTGRRTRTRYRLREVEAVRQLVDPVRIEYGALAVEPVTPAPAGTWARGLVRREDGAMVPPA